MSNKKRVYKIIINQFTEESEIKELSYIYHRTPINVFYKKNACKIEFKKSGEETIHSFIEKNYFIDSVQRFVLLNYFLTGKLLEIKSIEVIIDNEQEQVNDYVINTIFENNIPSVPNIFSTDQFINQFFKYYSKDDTRISSVLNYLIAISYTSPIERFIHLWMAFNGIYGHVASIVNKKLSKQVRKEYKQLNIFMIVESLGPIIDFSKTKVLSECKKLILADNTIKNFSRENFEKSELHKTILKKVNKKCQNEIFNTYFGLLLTQNIYKTRCNLFHGTRKVHIFSNEYRDENKFIKIANSILEDYLQLKYLDFFSEDYFENLVKNNEDKILEIIKK